MISVREDFRDRNVCVLGLGYVGLTLALVMADVGFKVLGVEIRDDVLKSLQKGEPHFFEPGIKDLLQRLIKARRIKFVKHLPPGTKATVYIITVGTPLDEKGRVRLDMIENVAREVSRNLKRGDLVILRSTVKIGTTSKVISPILKKSGVEFEVAFCPERTLEGQALRELRELPQIVGGKTVSTTVRASQIFQFLTPTVVRVASVEAAEMIKLVDNTSRDVHFAFSNEVARLCDAAGINAYEVIQAGKLGYPRTNLPLPGPVGGPCLVKDTYILAEGYHDLGVEPVLSLTARKLNEEQPDEVVAQLARWLKSKKGFPRTPIISLLGIAFKGRPITDDLRGTMARPIFQALRRQWPKARFQGYDPVVTDAEIRKFGLHPVKSLPAAVQGASVVLILNNHPAFTAMSIESLSQKMKTPGLIYDFWNSFSGKSVDLASGVEYMALGSSGFAMAAARDKRS